MRADVSHTDEQAIRELVANWLAATNSGDHDSVLRLMSEDVVFLQPGQPPMRGRAAFAAAQRALAGTQIEARADIREIRISGDLAYCWNHLTVTIRPPGGKPIRRAGDVLSVLRRENGAWVIYRDANLLTVLPE